MSRPTPVGRYNTTTEPANDEAYRREEYARLREDIARRRRAVAPSPNLRGTLLNQKIINIFHNLYYDSDKESLYTVILKKI